MKDRDDSELERRAAGRRRPRVAAAVVAAMAVSSLGTIAVWTALDPAHVTLTSGLAAATATAPDGGQSSDDGKGKGKGSPTVGSTDSGKGKGTPTPAPTDSGKGKGTPTPAPTDSGKGKGTPAPAPTDPGKGKGTATPLVATTLPAAQQQAGFRVRTLTGMANASLVGVAIGKVTFDTAAGSPTESQVQLRYAIGGTQVEVIEGPDPFPISPAIQARSQAYATGATTSYLMPAAGNVDAVESEGADGVAVVANLFVRSPNGSVTGADRQLAEQVAAQLA